MTLIDENSPYAGSPDEEQGPKDQHCCHPDVGLPSAHTTTRGKAIVF